MRRQLLWSSMLCAVLIGGCDSTGSKEAASGEGKKLNVVATIGMIADVAKNIGGDKVEVTALMGAGVDPHLYKASEGDVTRLSDANVIFYNGLHLEARMGEVLEQIGKRKTSIAITSKIDESKLLSPAEFEGAHDPHVWFDVKLWITAAEVIRDTLANEDAANAEHYKSSAEKYISQLNELDKEVREMAQRVPKAQRVLITAHDAFNYFGKAYDFEVRGLQGISTAAEAGTADVEELAKFIAERKIPAVFVESSVPQRTIEAVREAVRAKGFDVKIGGELFSDAMGDPGTEEGTYIGMVRANIRTIVNALGKSDGKMAEDTTGTGTVTQ